MRETSSALRMHCREGGEGNVNRSPRRCVLPSFSKNGVRVQSGAERPPRACVRSRHCVPLQVRARHNCGDHESCGATSAAVVQREGERCGCCALLVWRTRAAQSAHSHARAHACDVAGRHRQITLRALNDTKSLFASVTLSTGARPNGGVISVAARAACTRCACTGVANRAWAAA